MWQTVLALHDPSVAMPLPLSVGHVDMPPIRIGSVSWAWPPDYGECGGDHIGWNLVADLNGDLPAQIITGDAEWLGEVLEYDR